MSTLTKKQQVCLSCGRKTPHEELRRDDGSYLRDKAILICQSCGTVVTAGRSKGRHR